MKHIFVLNPAAGTGKQTDLFEKRISELCAARALAYEIYKTKSEKDASRFVRERCLTNQGETLRFYACGGDGTIGEVVGGAVGFDCAEVAVIPMVRVMILYVFSAKKRIFLMWKNNLMPRPCLAT